MRTVIRRWIYSHQNIRPPRTMYINTDEQVEYLLKTGLDGYDSEGEQRGGQPNNTQEYPVIVMNVNVLKQLNYFRGVNPQKYTGNFLFAFYVLPNQIKELQLYFVEVNDTPRPINIGKFVFKQGVSHTLSSFIEMLFDMVQTERTDLLLSILYVERTIEEEEMDNMFIETNQIDKKDILSFSESVSTVKRIVGEERMMTEHGWITEGFIRELRKKAYIQLIDDVKQSKWVIHTNRGGGDCFFLSVCQSGVVLKKDDERIVKNMDNIDECNRELRNFIAKYITQEMYENYRDTRRLPENVVDLETFKENYIKTSNYYADEMALTILIKYTNLYPVIINYIPRPLQTLNKTFLKTFIIDDVDMEQKQYVLLKHNESGEGHYELIGLQQEDDEMKIFTQETLPEFVKVLLTRR